MKIGTCLSNGELQPELQDVRAYFRLPGIALVKKDLLEHFRIK